jgi:deoxyribonuclease-4
MLYIGCHLSVAKGYKHMGEDALSIGANTFQFFTRNPRGSKAKSMDEKDAAALVAVITENKFAPILAHAPYTLNACSADPRIRELAEQMMTEDLANLEYLPHNMFNFHPGSHVGQGVEVGIKFIVDLLNKILLPEMTTTVLLETMAGKGSEIGSNFQELQAILKQVELTEKMGVCLDTCHVYDAGYDIVNDLEGVLEQFDEIIGLDKLRAIHLNDSLNPFSSHKDRHAVIGEGYIGLEALTKVINHPKLRNLPFYLETPNELPGHKEEIRTLREAYKE